MELTHSALEAVVLRSRMIVGIATLTIVASTMIIATPSAMNGIATQRRRCPPFPSGALWVSLTCRMIAAAR